MSRTEKLVLVDWSFIALGARSAGKSRRHLWVCQWQFCQLATSSLPISQRNVRDPCAFQKAITFDLFELISYYCYTYTKYDVAILRKLRFLLLPNMRQHSVFNI
jgi:hypothetical protein